MQTLSVATICSKYCLSPEEGEALYGKVYEYLKKGEAVLLEFSGVDTLASSFLNTAVGRLFGKFDHGFLESHLRWSGLDEQDDRILRLVIRNAKEHFLKTDAQRKAATRIVDKAIREL